jgi:peptide/nickel transport system substrate-binding protein
VASQSLIDFEGIAELLVNHWRDVGIYIHLGVEGETLYGMRGSNNEHQLSMWLAGGSENPWTYPIMTIPVDGGPFAPLNSKWYMTKGQKGVAPIGDLKRLQEIFVEGNRLPRAMRTELGKELWRIHSDNLYVIGTVGQSPAMNGVVVVKNNFRNVPDITPNSVGMQTPGNARPEQFFFEREKK